MTRRIFGKALAKHTTRFPALVKPQSRALPAWQEELSRAVTEMESYSQGDLGESAEAGSDTEQ